MMSIQQTSLYPDLAVNIERYCKRPISGERKTILKPLIDYIQHKLESDQPVSLNFICTHNSRRSQLAQIWAQTASAYYGLSVSCYSGGVEVTAFNERAVAAIRRAGFHVSKEEGNNPLYHISYAPNREAIRAYSKLFDDPENASDPFAAVMTCSHADENCPFIPGAEIRLPVRYKDPKEFDGTEQEQVMYDERSAQIASEMFYVLKAIKKS